MAVALVLLVPLSSLAPSDAQASPYYLVTSGTGNSVRKYDVQGNYLNDLVPSTTLLSNPQYMAVDDGVLYVANYGDSNVQKFDLATGAHLGVFADGPELDNPAFLTISSQHELVVGSLTNSRILRYDLQTQALLGDLVSPSAAPGPHGMLWRQDGDFLVSSRSGGLHRILEFDADGTFERELVRNNGLLRPLNLQYSPDASQIFVSNYYGRVLRFDAEDGAPGGAFTAADAGLNNPDGMTYGANGELVVAYWGSHSVARFDATSGQLLGFLGSGSTATLRPNHVLYVPEPGGATLLLMGGGCLLVRRRLR